ncbi:RE1 [Symbiodinium sp. KB8]|nr:RE1 [Symbiodinium sp. KB8]
MQLEKGVAPGGAFEASFCVSSSHWQAEQGCSRAQVLRLRRLAAVAPLMAILGLGITMISGEAGGNGKDGVGMAALVLRGVIPVGDKVNGKDRNLVLLVGGPAGQSSNRGIGKPIFLEKMAAGAQKLMEKLSGQAWMATESLDLADLKHPEGVQRLLAHLWQELEPLEHLRTFTTLSEFYNDFRRSSGQEFVEFDMQFRAHLKRLEEVGAKLEGLNVAYWFLEKSGLSSDLRKQVVAAASGEYDYPKLRKALTAIVPKVRKEDDNHPTPSRPSFNRQWKPRKNATRQVNTAVEDEEQMEDGVGERDEVGPEELEGELEILLTQAPRKRSEIERAKGFSKPESAQAREARIREMKSRMPCSACKAQGRTSFGHSHGDPECPFRKGGSGDKDHNKDKSVLAVVEEELSDSDEDILDPPSSSIYHSTSSDLYLGISDDKGQLEQDGGWEAVDPPPPSETKAGLCGFEINVERSQRRLDAPPQVLADTDQEVVLEDNIPGDQVMIVKKIAPESEAGEKADEEVKKALKKLRFPLSRRGGSRLMSTVAPKTKEEYVLAVASRSKVPRDELRKHTLDRLMAAEGQGLDPAAQLEEVGQDRPQDDLPESGGAGLGEGERPPLRSMVEACLLLEIEVWAEDAAKDFQLDRDLDMSEKGRPTEQVQRELNKTLPVKHEEAADERKMMYRATNRSKRRGPTGKAVASSDGSWVATGPQEVEEVSSDENPSPRYNTNLTNEEMAIMTMRDKNRGYPAPSKTAAQKSNEVSEPQGKREALRHDAVSSPEGDVVSRAGVAKRLLGNGETRYPGNLWSTGPVYKLFLPMGLAIKCVDRRIADTRWSEKNIMKALERWNAEAEEATPGQAPSEQVRDHSPEELYRAFDRGWARWAGPPARVTVDMEGGFQGKDFWEQVERRNQIVKDMIHNVVRQTHAVGRDEMSKKGDNHRSWHGPGYVVELQDRTIGGRCFLVAGEHLREAVGDEKHYGNPEIQKAIALFRKVPSEATYEDLLGQCDPEGEPMDVEQQPLGQDLTEDLDMQDVDLGSEGLSPEHAQMVPQVGWHVDQHGNPVLISHKVWAFRSPEPRYSSDRFPYRTSWACHQGQWTCLEREVKWADLDDQHQFIPGGPAAGLITIFQSRTRKEMCLDDVPFRVKRQKRQEGEAHVHAVAFNKTESKTKMKRMMEKEIHYHCIPEEQRELYKAAEDKEWKSWLDYESCDVLSPEDIFAPTAGQARLKGMQPGQIIKLLKPVYGRPDAPRAWYEELSRILQEELGVIKSKIDPALLMLRDRQGKLRGMMIVHVDDVMLCHDGSDLGQEVADKVHERFPFGTWLRVADQESGVTYCGKEIRIKRHGDEVRVTLSQNAFIDGRLQPMALSSERTRQPDERATEFERTDYRSVVGSLQWLAVQSRPDIAFECNQLQKQIADLRVADLIRANKTVREVVRNRLEIEFRPLGVDAELVAYHDAGLYSSIGVEIDEKQCEDILQRPSDKKLVYSQKGACVGFVMKGATDQERNARLNLIDWKSSTNRRVIESSFAAETHAAIMGHNMARFAQVLLSEIKYGSQVVSAVEDDGWQSLVPVTLVTDCKSTYDTIRKDGQHVGEKGNIDHAVLMRQLLTTRGRENPNKAKLLWVPTRCQLADGLTKIGRGGDIREQVTRGLLFHEESMKRKPPRQTGQKTFDTSVNVVQ